MEPSADRPDIDPSGNVLKRMPGCLTAIVLWAFLAAMPMEYAPGLPKFILYVLSTLLGIALVVAYVGTLRGRWGIPTPDVVQVIGNDLHGLLRRRTNDLRLRFPRGTSMKERVIHEALYILKLTGYILLISGIGAFLYQVMLEFGMVPG